MWVSPNAMLPSAFCGVCTTMNSESPSLSILVRWCAVCASSTASSCRLNSSCIFSSNASSGSTRPTHTKPSGCARKSLISSSVMSRSLRPSAPYAAQLATMDLAAGWSMDAIMLYSALCTHEQQPTEQPQPRGQREKDPRQVVLRKPRRKFRGQREDRQQRHQHSQRECERPAACTILAHPQQARNQQPRQRVEQPQVFVRPCGAVRGAEPQHQHQ